MLITNCSKRLVFLLAIVCIGSSASAVELEPIENKRFVPNSLARFEMVLGRLQLSTEYFRIGAAHERSKLDDGRERTRSISISTMRGMPTLQVRDVGGNEEVQLSFKADRKVDIVRSVGIDGGRYKLTYQQPDEGLVSLRVEFDDGREALEFKSRSLWHLAMAEPLAFDTYMQPCLSRLEPSWQINRSIVEVRGLMNNVVHPSDTKEIERLIEHLDAEFSSERDAAFLQLRSMGVATEYQLRQSLKADLSSQQQVSIKRLLSMIQPTGNDTPMRIAVWLSGE
jgi:hypothetical protein